MIILAAVIFTARVHRITVDCSETYRRDKTMQIDGHLLSLEVAASQAEQEKGLSDRRCIGQNQAMLFSFDSPGYYNFWMKDMRFPIDFVWISQAKMVIEVTDNVQPSTYPDTFTSNLPPQYVLELPAGRAAELGFTAGELLHF